MKEIIGIDLGTTNSLVCYWNNDHVEYVTDKDGNSLLASAVFFEDEKIYVGNLAKEKYLNNPKRGVCSFKRFMGTNKEYKIAGNTYTPVQLSAMVLKYLKELAENYIGKEIEEAIVTVPAYFNDKQRSDTKKAAKIAGLHVERLLNEPSSAALAYVNSIKKSEVRLLVFDFGGGTLDLSYVECFENIIEIVAVTGDNNLGGDDIDEAVLSYILNKKEGKTDGIHNDNPDKQILLRDRAKMLSEIRNKKAEFIGDNDVEICGMTLNNDKLFEICIPIFERIKKVVIKVLEDAGMQISEIDDFIMVGGSSKFEIVQRFLYELTGKKPIILDECDRVVAMGAGVYAGIRARNEIIKDYVMTDVCPFSLGTACKHKNFDEKSYFVPVIRKNSPLPSSNTIILETLNDYQRAINVEIYQGEEYYAANNVLLGEIDIDVVPKPAGMAKIALTFAYDINGILNVTLQNEEGEKKNILIKNHDIQDNQFWKYQEEIKRVQNIINPWENREYCDVLSTLEMFYENATGERKDRIGCVIAEYVQEMETSRIVRMREAYTTAKEVLRELEIYEEEKENMIFDLRNSRK